MSVPYSCITRYPLSSLPLFSLGIFPSSASLVTWRFHVNAQKHSHSAIELSMINDLLLLRVICPLIIGHSSVPSISYHHATVLVSYRSSGSRPSVCRKRQVSSTQPSELACVGVDRFQSTQTHRLPTGHGRSPSAHATSTLIIVTNERDGSAPDQRHSLALSCGQALDDQPCKQGSKWLTN